MSKGRRRPNVHSIAREICRRYLDRKSAEQNLPKTVGSRKLKRNIVPPYRRADMLLKREIYGFALGAEQDRHGRDKVLVREVRHRDEGRVSRLRESSTIDWALRLVNWYPVHAKSGFRPSEKTPLMNKEALSHVRTELKFAYRYAISPDFLTAFNHLVGGYELISAYQALDGYPLFDEAWLRKLQGSLHPAWQAFQKSDNAYFDELDDDGSDEVPRDKKSVGLVDKDGWPI